MATTTNYSWTTPDNTAYVKDGASAIRTLGSSVDTTLFTALGGAYPGLRLIKKQTIGSAVSSVEVTSAFSATYENYRILVTGGSASASTNVHLRLGSTTTGYYGNIIYFPYTGAGGANAVGAGINNAANFTYAGTVATANGIDVSMDIKKPFIAKTTSIHGQFFDGSNAGTVSGYLNDTNSYTAFTLIPQSGTITGGTIYVYGYGAS